MGFQNDKSDLVEKMSTAKVLTGLPKTKKLNSMDSIKSKSKNLMPFLMDLLKSSCMDNAKTGKDKARCEAIRILLEILIEFLPVLIKIIKEGLIKGIKAGLACGTDFSIPGGIDPTTITAADPIGTPFINVSTGLPEETPELTTTIDKLDFSEMMKMDPNGPAKSLFGNASVDFNRFLWDVIDSQTSAVWPDQNGNDLLNVTYNLPTATQLEPTITLKVSDVRGNTSFHQFLVDYVNSIQLFSTKNLMGTMTDMMFGSISASANIGIDTLLSQAKMDAAVEKTLEVDVCTDKLKIDDSFFDFSSDELMKMENDARNKSRGVAVIDLGCGLVETAVPLSLLDGLDELDTASPKRRKEILEDTVNNMGEAVSESGSGSDKLTMKANFQLNVVLNFPKILTRLVLTPKVVSLYQISHQTINNIVLDASNGYDFSKAARTFFEFVVRESGAALLEIIFNKIKKELIALVTQVATKIIKEKLGLYIGSVAGIFLTAATGALESVETPDTSSFV